MTGVTFNAASFSNRLMEIESALNNPKKNKVVNDRAELINKENGFVRFLKIMILPIARFFGADPFHHTRVHRVATTLVFQFLKLQNELTTEDRNRLGGIVTKLDEKTKHRYGKVMSVFNLIIQSPQNLPKPPPPPLPLPPNKKNTKLKPTDLEKEPQKTKKTQSSPAELKLLADAMKNAASTKSNLKHVTVPEMKSTTADTLKTNPFGVKLNPVPESPKKPAASKNDHDNQNPFEVFGVKVNNLHEQETSQNPAGVDPAGNNDGDEEPFLFIDKKIGKLDEAPLFTIVEIDDEDGLFNENPIHEQNLK